VNELSRQLYTLCTVSGDVVIDNNDAFFKAFFLSGRYRDDRLDAAPSGLFNDFPVIPKRYLILPK
jgi:hypothetical protein